MLNTFPSEPFVPIHKRDPKEGHPVHTKLMDPAATPSAAAQVVQKSLQHKVGHICLSVEVNFLTFIHLASTTAAQLGYRCG